MTEFSKLFSKFIHTKDIKVYSLAKYCNLDRSTLYKIISGKREPASLELVKKFSEFLQLTPREHQCFMEAYEITVVGADVYYRRKSIQDFLMHFPDDFSVKTTDRQKPSVSRHFSPCSADSSCISLQNQFDVTYTLREMITSEAFNKKGEIFLLLQPDYPYIFDLLKNIDIPDTIKIQHIFCLNNKDMLTFDYRSVHIEYLKMIFPLYIQNLNYQAYCFYDNIQSHFHNMNLLPCLILTSTCAITFSSDYQYGIFYREPSIISQFHKFFRNTITNCSPLFNVLRLSNENIDTLFNITLSTSNAQKNYLLQPEACFTPFISEEIIEHALLPELVHKDHFLDTVKTCFAGVSKIILEHPALVLFSRNGIEHFVKTGCLKEIPGSFARPFLPKERRQILEAFLPYCRNGLYRMLKPPLEHFPVNLHLCINAQMGFLTFENAASETLYFIINEPSFLMIFIDYIESLENKKESCFFSPKETELFIKKQISSLSST